MIPIFSAAAVNDAVDLRQAIGRVLDRQSYILGEEVKAFEREFAAYVGGSHCVTLANGTDALELALRSLGVGGGDKVVCAANAGFYGSTAVHAVGAVPVYADVDPARLTLSAATVGPALRAGAKAIIVTHLYGQMAAVEEIIELARAAGVSVVEDCAQSHGARRFGRSAGSLGDIGCFSFYPTKNLGAVGDGGAIVTSDSAIAERVRTLRQYGWGAKYKVDTAGGRNSRLDEVQAAILRQKLPLLDGWNAQRRHIAGLYNRAFAALPLSLPPSTGEDYVAHLYVMRLSERERLRRHLAAAGVGCDVHYPVPDHQQRAYPHPGVALPVTEQACAEALTLPCFPGMSDEQAREVIAAVQAFFKA